MEETTSILCVGTPASLFRDLTDAGFQISEIRAEDIAAALLENPNAVVVVRDRWGESNLKAALGEISEVAAAPPIVYFREGTETVAFADGYRSVLHVYERRGGTEESAIAGEAVLHALVRASLTKAS